ncbi:MAG: SMP-30/gluconolactonase/LRE family protein [Actinomycetia bacterium]|nr:SMP-30/gluconolactonase/LRE family protein [Actinomycetes bacterium]
MSVELALACRAEHAEGPIWDAATRRLWWVDITGHRLHVYDPASGQDCSWDTGQDVGAVALDQAGEPIIALPGGFAAFNTTTGRSAPFTAIEANLPGNRLNDAKCDPAGRLWTGTMAYNRQTGAGGLYVVAANGAVDQAVADLTIVNGPAFDADRERMYVADTGAGYVFEYNYDPATGAVGDQRMFVDLSETGGWPDGMTVDEHGYLWVAVGRDAAVHRYNPDGRLDGKVALPVTNPTSVAFGGADGHDLYITTSWYDLPAQERADQPLAGSIFVTRPGVGGPPAVRFAGLV